ncbi:zinc-dependent metalloprotease [Corynebacterium sp. ES2715-CONJ3]|uniref:zinc-dependent metalloprotease n=1 Tax=Corynebacterium sp. ES2715-CONJ3 TaxID=2974028 RepID=UPI002169A0DD|nr:zinc-dependent metalloprotease [Corynebacterium sp. ES2715-CONJ3]MCS4491535.1 zinc-dependent metalloprotease [Corynebacterium sp. ES2715-CONJ3]
MNNSGFGFSFNFGSDDDDDNDRRENSGNFSGGLGDMFNQLGAMLSGLGNSMNTPDAQKEAVNYEMAKRIGLQHLSSLKRTEKVSSAHIKASEESVRLAELWLDDATILPSASARVEAWSAADWLEKTLPQWKRLVSPVAAHKNEARLDTLPSEAKDAIGPMLAMMNQMSGVNYGMHLGQSLGDLATQALSGSDFGIPVAVPGILALNPLAIEESAANSGIPAQEVLVYVAAREAARQRLFHSVPWLVERLVSSVEEYAAGLEIDTSHIEEAMREINIESQDPQAIQEAMARLQDMDLEPRISSRNITATSRLESLLALVEGWVDVVVQEGLSDRIPQAAQLHKQWINRRLTGGSAENVFFEVVGFEIAQPPTDEAGELWRRVTVAVGTQRRDGVWKHPDFLPTADDITNPAEFIDSLLDESDFKDFDPIAEITALEKEREEQSSHEDDPENPSNQ